MDTILILNHHADLEGHRHYELGKEMAKLGYKVCVVASSYKMDTRRYLFDDEMHYEEVCDGLTYVWLRTKPEFVGSGAKRILNMFSYVKLVKKHYSKIVDIVGEPKFVIGSSVHPLAWEAAYYVSKKTGAKFVAEMRDVWPESLEHVLGISKSHPVVVFFDIITKRAMKRCKLLVGTGKRVDLYIEKRYGLSPKDYIWIPNGYNVDDFFICEDTVAKDLIDIVNSNWCVTYAGSVSASEGMEYLMDVVEMTNKKYNLPIMFLVLGDGAQRSWMEQEVKHRKINNVIVYGRVDKNSVRYVLAHSKLCVATARFGKLAQYGLSMNKLNDYLYSETPVLLTCKYYNPVDDSGAGESLVSDDKEAFVEAIYKYYNMSDEEREAIGKKGRTEIEKNYAMSILAKRYIDKLESIN